MFQNGFIRVSIVRELFQLFRGLSVFEAILRILGSVKTRVPVLSLARVKRAEQHL